MPIVCSLPRAARDVTPNGPTVGNSREGRDEPSPLTAVGVRREPALMRLVLTSVAFEDPLNAESIVELPVQAERHLVQRLEVFAVGADGQLVESRPQFRV